MKKLLLIITIVCISTSVNGMMNNVTTTRGSNYKTTPSKKNTQNIQTRRGQVSSPKKSKLEKIREGSPIFESILLDNAINRGDARQALCHAKKMKSYGVAHVLLTATTKPAEKVEPYIDKYQLPKHIDRKQFVKIAQKGRERREARLLLDKYTE